jgi:phage tail-like protein
MSSRRLVYGVAAVLLLSATAIAVIAAPASSGARVPASSSQAAGVRFALIVGGSEVAAFGDLVALTSGFETSQLELSVGGSTPKLSLPGKRTPPTVVLKRGMTRNIELWDWHDDALKNGSRAWKNSVLVMYDFEGKPVASWTMVNAWPSKIEVDTLSSGGQATETVTLVCEHLQRVPV